MCTSKKPAQACTSSVDNLPVSKPQPNRLYLSIDMKKLLPFLFVMLLAQLLFSQCAIDSSIQAPGFHPDTGSFLKPACTGSQYEDVIQIYVPTTVTIAIGTYPVEYVQLDSVPDFPATLHYATNPASGKLNGGERGCINVFGQVNVPPGDYKFTIHYTAVFTFNGGSIPLNLLAPYKLHVDTGTRTYYTYADTACSNRGYYFNGQWQNLTGTYNDTISNSAGCDSVITLNLFIQNFDTTLTISNDTLIAPTGYSNYTFYSCGAQTVLQSGSNNRFVCSPGDAYRVSMSSGQCSDTTTCFAFSGFSNLNTETIYTWPNPVSSNLNLRFTDNAPRELSLYDINGRLCLQTQAQSATAIMDVQQLSTGCYLLLVKSASGNSRIRVDKQ